MENSYEKCCLLKILIKNDGKYVYIPTLVVIIFETEHRDFKLTSQLGYSRKTLWKSKICELIILSILTLIFSSINFSSNKLIN